jgi:hypothetical protein
LKISRGSVYYLPRPVQEADLAIMQRLDRSHLEYPFAGSRMLRGLLAAKGCKIGRRRVAAGRWRPLPSLGHGEDALFGGCARRARCTTEGTVRVPGSVPAMGTENFTSRIVGCTR